MTDQQPDEPRVIDLQVEVPGTPDEVWRAIATGPGISSWYVPTTVEEREGGATTSKFGEGPEMLIPGQVVAWEPPHRVKFAGTGADAGFAFEWLVEARDGGSCIVRLVNSGFGTGEEWDGQYDGMSEGWRLFLHNLQLHLTHFAGGTAVAMLPMAMWPGPRDAVWEQLTAAFGLSTRPQPGELGSSTGASMPPLVGRVVESESWRASLLLEEPAAGTAFLAAEGTGDSIGVSVWLYVYGDDAASIAARDEPGWTAWLAERAGAAR